jgi:hypothetical protein
MGSSCHTKRKDGTVKVRDDYEIPEEIVSAAQVMGARKTGDNFFPRWKVLLLAQACNLKYDISQDGKKVAISMRLGDSWHQEALDIRPIEKKAKKEIT